MSTAQVIDLPSDRALAAVRLRLAGVPAENITAADVVLKTAVADAIDLIRDGLPVLAEIRLANAADQADRLLAVVRS